MIDEQRKAFEKWATSDNRNLDVSISPVNNTYLSLATLLAWEAWQEAQQTHTQKIAQLREALGELLYAYTDKAEAMAKKALKQAK